MQDKRRYHRMKMQIPMSFRVPPRKDSIATSTLDISGTGISFITAEDIKVRQELLMYLLLPNNEAIEMHAKVVRVQKTDGGHRVAVRIVDPIKFDEKKFASFYAKLLVDFFGKKS